MLSSLFNSSIPLRRVVFAIVTDDPIAIEKQISKIIQYIQIPYRGTKRFCGGEA